MKDNLVYLQHIVDAIEAIEDYLDGINYQDFSKNRMMVDAVVRQLEIIGEAANSISGEFKNKHRQIPFRDMIDMRNFLTHEYFGVDAKTVWDTCKTDLPDLKRIIGPLVSEL